MIVNMCHMELDFGRSLYNLMVGIGLFLLRLRQEGKLGGFKLERFFDIFLLLWVIYQLEWLIVVNTDELVYLYILIMTRMIKNQVIKTSLPIPNSTKSASFRNLAELKLLWTCLFTETQGRVS